MKYLCVTDSKEARSYISGKKIVAFDFETSPKEEYSAFEKAALNPHMAEITGMSLSAAEGTGIYIPVRHTDGPNMNADEFNSFLKEFISNREIVKIAHNLAFEAMFCYALGFVILPPVYDTIAASQLSLKSATEFRKLYDSGLKRLALELCGVPLPTYEAVTAGRAFSELNPQEEKTLRYACADSDFALRLYRIFNTWFDAYLPGHRYICEQVESPMAVYTGMMKYNGVPINAITLSQKGEDVKKELVSIKERLEEFTGGIDVGASANNLAVKKWLFQLEGLPVLKCSSSGAGSLDDETLILLQDWCREYRPELADFFSLVQRYRKLSKINSTYIEGYAKHIDSSTGRIHPELFSLSTDTGRMSCNNPNMQNMPRPGSDPIGIRSLICAPEGQLLLSCDFSQIELRVGTFFCRDEAMMKTYEACGDIHAKTTSIAFGISEEEAADKSKPDYKERRTVAKNLNFGMMYGIYPKGFQKTLRFKAGIDKSLEECEAILSNLKAGYPSLNRWQMETVHLARMTAYVETFSGRRRYLPEIRSEDRLRRSFAERCAVNTPVQGTAADILKLACSRMLPGLLERPWLKPVLQIHDELDFLVPEEKLSEAVIFIKECMETKPFDEFDVPLVAEASWGKDFGEMKESELQKNGN